MAEVNSKGNGVTNVLLGGALLALGYVIYQTYPEQITANAQALKTSLMNLFNKNKSGGKQDNNSVTTENSNTLNSHQTERVCSNNLLSSEDNDIDLTKQPILHDELVIDMSNPNEIDIYETQQFVSDMPYLLPTTVLQHYDASDDALLRIGGRDPKQMYFS